MDDPPALERPFPERASAADSQAWSNGASSSSASEMPAAAVAASSSRPPRQPSPALPRALTPSSAASASPALAAARPRPTQRVLDELVLKLQLAGVLVDAPRREQVDLLSRADWDVTRAVALFFQSAGAEEVDDEDADAEDGSSSGRGSRAPNRSVGGVKEEEKSNGVGNGASASAPAASASPALPPERHTISVTSDSGDQRTYADVKAVKTLAKLFADFTALAKRRLEFFLRGVQVQDTDTPLALGMARTEKLEARAPARVKRSFTLPGAAASQSPAVIAAADALAASLAASAKRSSPEPPSKRIKGEDGSPAAAAAASAAAPAAIAAAPADEAPPAPVLPWSELLLGSLDFSITQTRAPLPDGSKPVAPTNMMSLQSFLRDMEKQAWAAGVKNVNLTPDGDEFGDPDDTAEDDARAAAEMDAYARHAEKSETNARVVRLLKSLSSKPNAFKAHVRLLSSELQCHCVSQRAAAAGCTGHGCTQLHLMRLSVSLLPGAHNLIIPQGNFLLPLLSPALGAIIERALPRRPTPLLAHAPLQQILDLSVRTKFQRHEKPHAASAAAAGAGASAGAMMMEVEDEEEQKEEIPAAAAAASSSPSAAAAVSSSAASSAASASAGSPVASASSSSSALSDEQRLRVSWGLSPDIEDDLLCAQTAPLLWLSDAELSRRCGLNVTLRDYQSQTVLWALKQECSESMASPFWTELEIGRQRVWYSPCFQAMRFLPLPNVTGGMICEEMGLGKTVEMLALIQLNPAPAIPAAASARASAASSILLAPPPASAAADLTPSKTTLIIAPTSLVGQWFVEISARSSASRPLKVLCWHGGSRTQDLATLLSYDVVLTSFGIVGAEVKKNAASGAMSLLHRVQWHRLIVDESHNLKSRASGQSARVLSLASRRRWLLSGTPLNTQIDDLFGQFEFFQLPLLCHSHVLTAVRAHAFGRMVAGSADAKAEFTAAEVYGTLERMLTQTMMRHKKIQRFNGRSELVALPPRSSDVIPVPFSPEERAAYDTMFAFAQARFGELAQRRSVASQHVAVMALLSPLRQACSSGKHDLQEMKQQLQALVQQEERRAAEAAATRTAEAAALAAEQPFNDNEACTICLDQMDDALMTPCRHLFCSACIIGYCTAKGKGEKECPLCRNPFKRKELRAPPQAPAPPPADESKDGGGGSSASAAAAAAANAAPTSVVFRSKVNALMAQLLLLRRERPAAKSLVFSQWTQSINHVSERLREAGINAVVLKGNLSMQQRKEALDKFINDPTCTVFVMSLRAGAVGLTLTAATEVFLLEPALNPALTSQAINRVHRVGQTNPVRIHHLVMKDSIEERILAATKAQIDERRQDDEASAPAASSRGRGAAPLAKDSLTLRAAELQALFA